MLRQFGRCLALAIHSFTGQLRGQSPRPWHAGFLARKDLETSTRLQAHIAARATDLVLAINQPYQIDDETDWFIPVHAERRNLAMRWSRCVMTAFAPTPA